MKINSFTIGTDPELFLERDGVIISAAGLIGGTKKNPKLISDEGHAVQEDNVMVEFNTPPAYSKDEFINHINFVKEYLNTLCELYPGTKLNYTTSAEFDDETLSTKQARMIGCEPSYNVYLQKMNPRPSAKTSWRSCGGHIHIGYDNPNESTTELIIYAMDMILGLQSILMDDDIIRKKSYGKAGEFRFKDFGCEYRVLSNFWIKNDELIDWVYESTLQAINLVNSDIIDELIKEYSDDVKLAIDTMDIKLAESTYSNIQLRIKENKEELILK